MGQSWHSSPAALGPLTLSLAFMSSYTQGGGELHEGAMGRVKHRFLREIMDFRRLGVTTTRSAYPGVSGSSLAQTQSDLLQAQSG